MRDIAWARRRVTPPVSLTLTECSVIFESEEWGPRLVNCNGTNDRYQGRLEILEDEKTIRFVGIVFSKVAVRTTDDLTPVEVRDMDEVTTKKEVLEAIKILGDTSGTRVVSMRRAYGGAQTAVVLIPKLAATKICEAGRIRVGLVYARVRPTVLSDRCFRCLAFGHVAGKCTGVDRRSCCWRCGGAGHRASQCTALIQEATDFKNVLTSDAGRVLQSGQQINPKRPEDEPRLEQVPIESAASSSAI